MIRVVKPTKSGIKQAVAVLKQGGVIVYPTDTAYALGGIYNLRKVTEKVLKIKKRRDKKFTIIASSRFQAEKNFKLNSSQKKLAKKYWPGPLSIAVSRRFAVRVPKNAIARDLARLAEVALIASSANVSGDKAAYSVPEVIKSLGDKKNQLDLIIDAGRLRKVKPSTVILVKNNEVKVLRQGAVKVLPSRQ